MEPTDNLPGGHSCSGDYNGCSAAAGTTFDFDQQDQEDDLSFLLSELCPSPPPSSSSPWQSMPPAEGFAGPPENLLSDGRISLLNLDEVAPCSIPAAVAQETNYAPLVATHGTGAGGPRHNTQISNSMTCPQKKPHPIMEPTDNQLSGGHRSCSGDDYGCPAAASGTFLDQLHEQEDDLISSLVPPAESFGTRSSSSWPWPSSLPLEEGFAGPPENLLGGGQISPVGLDEMPCVSAETNYAATAAPLMATHATVRDELPHQQQQLPLPRNDPQQPEAQPGGGSSALMDLSPADEVHIQQKPPTILPSQPPSCTPVINPGPDEANHAAASAPMGSQGQLFDFNSSLSSTTSNKFDEEVQQKMMSLEGAIKNRGLPSRQQLLLSQDGSSELFGMVIDMIQQFGRHIGNKMMKDEEQSSIVWKRFWTSSHCGNVTVVCQYCRTIKRYRCPPSVELLRHLESYQQLPASSRTSKETQWSSQALQIKEIAETENHNGKSESIETASSNFATTAARVDMRATDVVVRSPSQQHQWSWPVPMDLPKYTLDEPNSMWDLIFGLSRSSYRSPTTKSSHDGFRLEFSNCKGPGCTNTIVQVHSSPAWVRVSENRPDKDHAGVFIRAVGSSNPLVNLRAKPEFVGLMWPYAWKCLYAVMCSLGFSKEFATHAVTFAFGWVNGCNLWLRSPSPRCNNKGKGIVEQGDDVLSFGKRKRKQAAPRSKVWNHFTKVVVEAQGSKATMARCNYCGFEQNADSKGYGTSHLTRHIKNKHPEHAESL